ncbi:hypothetical protein M011DRAFT_408831 [Sporormia fimetaria CBS 119925]|uniref:HTH APSES-type domain-containing protein n=1 Tax=Sporormia fimetaria CBS 119925 TaxID=1340428 RepID=A0A6A6V4F5_9PLEO|nr:hypothetical protein M011DRAFT_408831 [Sporormia fimetaria CBS 119925]
MVGKRTLPERHNPLLDPDSAPSHEDLVGRRRLGQTNLAVKPGLVGVTSATKSENLGTFDYAHLRVPLPKDLSGSGIFTLKASASYPESYFLMRRSSDGYISATGMFKAAFPWASLAEEEAERRFQKTFPSAGPEEVAGSVWIAPEEALHLSEEYKMRHWIAALLDPTPIEKGSKDKNSVSVQQPPKFDIMKAAPVVLPPTSTLRPTRARSSRSASPSKAAVTPRKIATPRKPRATRSAAKAEPLNGEEVVEMTKTEAVEITETSSTTNAPATALSNGIARQSAAADLVEADTKPIDTVRIEVQETVEQNGDVETTTTNVKIDVPADHPELPTPEDPTKMIEEAKRMVEEARELELASGSQSLKRKVQGDDEIEAERPVKQARTVATVEQKLYKERVSNKALIGVGVMAAIG